MFLTLNSASCITQLLCQRKSQWFRAGWGPINYLGQSFYFTEAQRDNFFYVRSHTIQLWHMGIWFLQNQNIHVAKESDKNFLHKKLSCYMHSPHGILLYTLCIYTYYCVVLYILNHVHYIWRPISRTAMAWHAHENLNPCKTGSPLKELIARTEQEPGSPTHDPAPLHLFYPCPLHLFIWFHFKEATLVQGISTLPFRKIQSWRLELLRNPRELLHSSHAFKITVSN